MTKIVIDTQKCLELAQNIRRLGGVPLDKEDPLPYAFPEHVAHNGWWATVAINQQTTPVVGLGLKGSVKGVQLRGWDYLLQTAIYTSNQDPAMFTRAWLLGVTPELLREIYYDKKEGDTMSQIEIRASLLVDLGKFLERRGWTSIHSAYLTSGGYILRSDGSGLGQILAEAQAYKDPVQKKLFYLLAIMRNQGFWEYTDSMYLSSPVNYHEQRGHLRIGTVKILDATLENKIRTRENISDQEDIEIRFAVRRVIEFIAQLLEVTPSMMHYYFWNHIRNCCSRDNPHCLGCGTDCKLPHRYRLSSSQCIFSQCCRSSGIPVSAMFIEPRLDHTTWQ